MRAHILVHLEASESGPVWWAESADFPGFSAAADTLVDLRRSATAALAELAEERGESLGPLQESLAVDGNGSEGADMPKLDQDVTEAASLVDAVSV
ncbi:MAG: hypothetical protein M0013_06150 [Actinomycetota bacterium]|nr:hypothetical protein [Actinomycetota bacterium]